jgi:hypothetical protein
MTEQQATSAAVYVSGNVTGTIIVGDNNLVVHDNHGTIIYKQAGPRVQPRNLSPKPPRKPRTFIGRQRELAQLEEWIAAGEPVILHGVDGLGKTTLSKQVANGPAAASQPNGVAFVEGVDEAGQLLGLNDIVQRLFDALFESDPQLKVDLVTARTYLSNVRPFVLLNSISLPGESLEKLLDLFPSSPILVTTESTPRGDAFQALAMPPLARQDALTLLADRSGLALSEETRPGLEALSELLADIPAALVMAANAIREGRHDLDSLLAGLRAITPKATVKAQAALERIYSLLWDSLSADEQQMLLQAAAAPGLSVNRQWLENVAGGKAVSGALESMEVLQANSPRLRLMPGLRSMLLERDVLPARERLLDELLTAVKSRSTDFEYMRDELGNLLGLFNWCVTQKRWSQAIALGRALDPYLTLSGLWDSWHIVLTSMLDTSRLVKDRVLEGWALHQLGTYHLAVNHLVEAQSLLQQASSLRRELGDETGLAYSQHNLSLIPGQAASSSPASQMGGGLFPWVVGIFATVVLIGALALAGVFRSPPPVQPNFTLVPTIPVLLAIIDTATIRPTVSPVPTATFTPLPAATSTETVTPAPSQTPTPSLVPTFAIFGGRVSAEESYCFYGPGRFYLGLTGLIRTNPVQVTGRAEDRDWVYVNFPGVNPGDITRCWVQADTLQMNGAFSSLEVVYPNGSYHLPPSRFPPVQNVSATRSGDFVTVTWDEFDLPLGERESAKSARYLIEAWLCKGGVVTFTPTPVYSLTGWASLTDEAGCSEPSHARVLLAEKHGYATSVEIAWPPHP